MEDPGDPPRSRKPNPGRYRKVSPTTQANPQESQQTTSHSPHSNAAVSSRGRRRGPKRPQQSASAPAVKQDSALETSVTPALGELDPTTGEFFPSGFSARALQAPPTVSELLVPHAEISQTDVMNQARPKQRSARSGAQANPTGKAVASHAATDPSPSSKTRRQLPKNAGASDIIASGGTGNRADLRRAAQNEAALARNKLQKRANIADFSGGSQGIYDNVEAPITSLDPEGGDDVGYVAPDDDAFDPQSGILNSHVVHDHANNTRSRRGGGSTKLSTEGQTELAAKIINDLLRNKYECAVCYAAIKRHVAVWSCSKCYSLFHIFCVKKWSQSSTSSLGGVDKLQWSCPKCRSHQVGRPESLCFCGRTRDPAFDPYVIPHSCGEPCTKTRNSSIQHESTLSGVVDPCPHPCGLLCHPGPCPPCSSMGPLKHCHCGKTEYRLRCGVPDPGRSCENICLRTLQCGRHMCRATCHQGACAPCDERIKQRCYCGKVEDIRTCGTEEAVDTSVYGASDPRHFSCKNRCGKKLSCGNHDCEEICHVGPCKPCARSPNVQKTCPCGATPLSVERKTCLDPILACNLICNRLLACGKHRCESKCHEGPCIPCTASVPVPCRCGSTTTTMPCLDVYPNQLEAVVSSIRCERLCDELKECGRHRCANRCCPARRNKTDPEGLHICRITCGKRLGCGVHTCKQLCHRGKCTRCLEARFEDIVCPCGRTIQEAPIVCGTPPLNCPYDCVRPRPCGHPSSRHACHSTGDCPACLVLVNKPCMGSHTIVKNVPCFKQDVSCGKVCGKQMRCGLHACARVCHGGPCELHDAPVSEVGPSSCGHKCELARESCEHTCQATCHPGQKCPDTPCKLKSRIYCSCTRLSTEVPCTGGQQRVLACDEKCELEKRNRRLAEAFGILGTGKEAPRYSDTLLNMAKSLPNFIVKLEKMLDDFLKTPPSVQRTQLPMMDRVQRQCVHELAKYYNLETESYDVPRIDSNMKIVELAKRRDSASPTIPLSAVAGVSEPAAPARTESVAVTTTSIMHFYDLSVSIQTTHVNSFLSPFAGEYTLQWIDDNNCLAVFKEPTKMLRALQQLRGGQFKIKPYSEQTAQAATSSQLPAPRPTAGGWASLTASGGPKKPRTPPPFIPPQDPIAQSGVNRYAALDAPSQSPRWSGVNDASSVSSSSTQVDQRPEDIPDDWSMLAASTDVSPPVAAEDTRSPPTESLAPDQPYD
eukprot:TRINITY_DN5919_c0_g1_i1.p1 TRINITY_DN5919_c0_g1~~TRINITY_DN5919_c0_g1_i1.p1  ORF type:complete len:1247 (-),score=99.08 TRINITY_DN5919_c0_g1_i1:1399-5055(-)